MNDSQRRIRERQAVSDAFGRGEIDWQEYQDRLAALPKIRPPQDRDRLDAVKRRGLDLSGRLLDIVERAFTGKDVR